MDLAHESSGTETDADTDADTDAEIVAEVVDVVVVGAGPTGLTAAGDLARAGRSVVVLERRPRTSPTSRAFATMPRTLELLEERGLAAQLLARGTTARRVGVFSGAGLDLSRVRSRHAHLLVAPQSHVDALLGRYAAEQGARVHRGVEVVDLHQDGAGVTVTARPRGSTDPAASTRWRARYVVGADGAHSTVRRLLGVGFPGRTLLSSLVLADVRLDAGPDGAGPSLADTPDRFAFLVPYGREDPAGGSWFRSMTWDRGHQVGDDVPVDDEEVVRVLTSALGRDAGLREIGWRSRFHCEERQVRRYRCGRVLLAGDAAHVHSPTGGQGMNTGIQDAVNLAWKVDAVLGGAHERVLDTYQAERHPVGRRVLLQSGLLLRAITLRPRAARALRDALVPRLLGVPPVHDLVAGSFAGTGLRYRRRRGEHHLVGTLAGDVALAGGRLPDVRHRPGFVLVHRRGDAAAAGTPGTPGLLEVERADAGPALLVRPDGYVAWAGERDDDGWWAAWRWWTGAAPAGRFSRGARLPIGGGPRRRAPARATSRPPPWRIDDHVHPPRDADVAHPGPAADAARRGGPGGRADGAGRAAGR